MNEFHRRCDVRGLNIDMEEGDAPDPGFVFDLNSVVADADDEIGGAQQPALCLSACPFDTADRKRVILVDHAFRHRGGGERQAEMFNDIPQSIRTLDAHRRCAKHGDRPLGVRDELAGAFNRGIWRRRNSCEGRRRCNVFLRRRQCHVLR